MAILKEFSGEIHKKDALMMASEIVSNDTQIVIVYSRVENHKILITEENYIWDGKGEYYTHLTHYYYETSRDVRSTTCDFLTLEEMVEEIVDYLSGDLKRVDEWYRVFIETI